MTTVRKAFPTGSAVSRALRRDAGIITVSITRAGYHVANGMKGITAPSISVSVSDLPDSHSDVRRASELRDQLVELGWKIDLADGSAILYVNQIGKAES